MKTRYIFEPKDFEGSGQMIIRDSYPVGSDNFGGMSSVAYKIGYIQGEREQKIAKISLSDGMINQYSSLEVLCERLNTDDRGYRPMTKDEILQVMGSVGSRFV